MPTNTKTATPYYGGGTPYRARTTANIPLDYYPRGRGNYVQVVGLGALHGVGLGQLRGLRGSEGLAPAANTAGTLVGASLAGAITGYLAAGSGKGALTGASYLGGISMLANAGSYWQSDAKGSAAFVGLLGLAGVSLAIYRFKH